MALEKQKYTEVTSDSTRSLLGQIVAGLCANCVGGQHTHTAHTSNSGADS